VQPSVVTVVFTNTKFGEDVKIFIFKNLSVEAIPPCEAKDRYFEHSL